MKVIGHIGFFLFVLFVVLPVSILVTFAGMVWVFIPGSFREGMSIAEKVYKNMDLRKTYGPERRTP